MQRCAIVLTAFAALLVAVTAAPAQEDAPSTQPGARTYSRYPEQTFPNRVFFGDMHLHTSYSTDAGMIGNTLGPEEAYRFARGETVTSSTGLPVKLPRPLDFLAVTDHAEGLGVAPMIAESNPVLLKDPLGKKLHDLVKAGKPDEAYDAWRGAKTAGTNTLMANKAMVGPAWQRVTTAAEKYNEPGRFTAFIGYEWTSDPQGNNLHRNVIFRDGKDRADRVMPFSAADSLDPEKLWSTTSENLCVTRGLRRKRRFLVGLRASARAMSGWRPTRRRPADGCSRSRTTATSRTASCSMT